MPAKAQWVVVRCMDPRLNVPLRCLIDDLMIPEDHGLISVPGGVQDINDPTRGVFMDAVERISMPLHGAKYALVIQHTDCGAYGGRAVCGGNEKGDIAFHQKEIRKALQHLRSM